MAKTQQIWDAFLRDAFPSRFPALIEPSDASTETDWLSSRPDSEHKHQNVIDDQVDPARDSATVCAAFATLLSIFVGVQNVSFLYAARSPKDNEATVTQMVSLDVDRNSTASNLINYSVSYFSHSDAREGLHLSPFTNFPADQEKGPTLPFNTLLLSRESDEVVRSTLNNMHPDIDLVLVLSTQSSTHESTLWFRPRLLTGNAAQSILDTFIQLLSEFRLDSSRAIRDISFASTSAVDLMKKWNMNVPTLLKTCVHHLFEEQARKTPASIALCSSDNTLTFAELDDRATRLSSKLKQLDVGANDVVLLCFEKSTKAVVSQLAVLKAGGACAYIHLEFPAVRIQQIAEKSQARVALASPSTAAMLSHLDLNVITVTDESIAELESVHLHRDPAREANPHTPAFVLFTSGSTGVPKGIIIEHSAVCTSFIAHGEIMILKDNPRVLQFAAYTWDASVSEIWTTLLFGGTVCVPSEQDRVDRLAQIIQQFQVNEMWLTPTVACLLDPDDVPTLKRLFLIGEPATRKSIDRWADRLDLRNAYGPTEASMFCSCSARLESGCETRNVGYTLGSQVFVVDPEYPPAIMPPGAIGELVISGPILARSYLEGPEERSDAFGPRPAWPEKLLIPSSSSSLDRMYRTGDLGRMTVDGKLWHCGRKDTQVKLHGHRIQVDDIQQNLNQCLDFKASIVVDVVVPAEDEARPMLAAFVPIPGHATPDSSGDFVLPPTPEVCRGLQSIAHELRNRGSEKLPSYMVPTLYLPISHAPRSRSGKLDRRTLKDYVAQKSLAQLMKYDASEGDQRQILTAKEGELVALLADILRVPGDMINVSRNFVELGGDSVCAMRLADVGRRNGFNLTVAKILRSATLKDLITASVSTRSSKELPPDGSPFELLAGTSTSTEKAVAYAAQQCNILPKDIQDMYPCTSLQEGIFALSQKRPGSYVGQYHFRLGNDIDLDRYSAAWETIVARADVLRTRFVYKEGASEILQAVIREEIQWRREENLELYLSQDRDLAMHAGSPLIRFAVIKTAASKHVVFTAHHALYDDWSMALILDNVRKLYRNLESKSLLPFRNFIKFLSISDTATATEYWKNELQNLDAPVFPALPHPRYVPHATGEVERRIAQPPRHARYTDATFFRATLCLLIARYTASNDAFFGANVAGRSVQFKGIQDLVGPALATVPIRVAVEMHCPIDDFLARIQEQSNTMMEFEHTGLSQIRQATGIDCEFQTLLLVHLPTSQKDHIDPLIQPAALNVAADSYGLMLEISSNEVECTLNATFDPNMISPHQMQRFVNQFVHALRQLHQSSPTQPLSTVDLCSPEDLEEIAEWNRQSPEIVSACVHHAFEAQAMKTPEAEAIVAWDGNVTYEELDRLCSTLAHHLSEVGVGPETIVPLCFEKSYLAIVAGMAVLKAGGACVYLDPKHPVARLTEMIEQVNAKVVVCGDLLPDIFASNGRNVLQLTRSWLDDLPVKVQWSSDEVKPSNAAFVVYTSGSTGEPKGIVQDHQAYCSVMAHHRTAMGCTSGRRVFQFAANTWDVFLSDVMTSLANGACICVPSNDDRLNDPQKAMRQLNANQATLPPAVARMVHPENVPQLEVLCVGGDMLSSDILRRWASHTRVINMYGPSEVSVWSTYKDEMSQHSDVRDLGRGSGSLVWLTEPSNPHLLTPIGTIGEIVLSGPGLARGYLRDDVRTAAAFISAPTWLQQLAKSHDRIYRTGDMAYFGSDGDVIFCGRRDDQIKLYGQRIELGGVQAELERSSKGLGISHIAATVIKPRCRDGEQFLTAFLAFQPSITDTATTDETVATVAAKMKQLLRRKLPSYMIPSLFIEVPRIPLTSHGKVDRSWLQNYGSELTPEQLATHAYGAAHGTPFRGPSTAAEKQMTELWAEILVVDAKTISLDDSFSHLGGDSISAMRLVALARSRGLQLGIRDVLQATDLAESARQIVS